MYDTIITLGHALNQDGSLTSQTHERLDLSLNLYHQDLAHTLTMSGGHICYGELRSLAGMMADYAIERDLPKENIFLEEISLDTVGQAVFIRIMTQQKGWSKLLVVSHDYHLPRVKTIFDFIFDSTFSLEYRGVAGEGLDLPSLLASEAGSLSAFRETFANVSQGDLEGILRRLKTSHPLYKTQPI